MAVKVSVLLRDELNILQSCLGKKNAQHLQKRMFHEHPRLRDCQANPQLGLTICSSMVWKVGQGTTNSVLQHRFATSTRHQMNHAEVNTGTTWQMQKNIPFDATFGGNGDRICYMQGKAPLPSRSANLFPPSNTAGNIFSCVPINQARGLLLTAVDVQMSCKKQNKT